MAIREERHQYIVLFRGDDSDFVGNQQILLKLETELDLTGCKAHFRFLDFKQDFDEIPADKTLELVFQKAQTAKFPLGAMDAELWLEDSTGKRRTVANRIHVVVTNSVKQAYDNDDPQAITVVITSGSAESISWNNITGKPSTFPPSAHTHPISQVEGLQGELNQKVNKVQNATAGNLASLTSDGGIQNSGESVASLKEYTNTQVATNTANFLGTYDYTTDLGFTPPSTSADVDNDAIAAALPSHVDGTPTNNDYVFVVINYTATTPADEFRRFKYNATDSEWFYEFTLNSASFTSAQWAAINSGITGVVAPSSSATTGQAASAKDTGDALAARPTKAQLDEGWWSEWTIVSAPEPERMRIVWGTDGGPIVGWVPQVNNIDGDWATIGSAKGDGSSTDLTWTDGVDAETNVTATRHRVSAPVPTKPSDIGAASVADATLTPQFGEWTFSNVSDGITDISQPEIVGADERYWTCSFLYDGFLRVSNILDTPDPSATELNFTYTDEGLHLHFTATRAVVGYTLGNQTTKPLQPQGDYQPAGNYASPSDIGIPAFSTTATYALGAKVVYDNALWNCTTAVSTAGAWNAANWTKVCNLSTDATPTANSKALMTSGNIKTALDLKADASNIYYDLGTPIVIDTASSETVEGETVTYGEATLADRTANRVTVAAAIAELRLTFPAAVSGKVRDFGLRVEIGTGSAALTAPALVPIAPTGETIKLENNATEIPALADGTATAKGVTLLYFSETAPGVFLVKGEQVEEVTE